MAGDHGVGQRIAERVERPWPHGVFEARHRGLRRQPPSRDGVPIEQQLLDRILGQAVGVIRVRIPARDPEDPLGEQVGPRMGDARGRPRVGQRLRQGGRQPQRPVGGLEQDRAAVRARVRLVKRRHQGAIEEVRKSTACGTVGSCNGNASVCAKVPQQDLLYHSEAFLFVRTHTHS